ncbi:hypothetical protein BH24DEI2_BH24DEI2_12460 [soil metagenome]
MDTPFLKRLGTRLGLLLLVIVMVLAGATAILLSRGFNQLDVNRLEQLRQYNVAPTAELSGIIRGTVVNLIAVFLLTLVGAAVFSRSLLTEPITSLVKATQEVAAGNLGVTLPVTSHSELGLLTSSFNTMSTSLAERTQELLEVNRALRESEIRLEARVAERTSELLALLELSNSIALTLDDLPLIEEILTELHDIAPYRAAAVFERLGDSAFKKVVSEGDFSNVDEETLLEAVTSKSQLSLRLEGAAQLVFPLMVRDKAVGTLLLEFADDAPLDERKLQLITAFANQAGVALENISLYQQVQETAAFEERQHLARELHDSVSQALYSIVLGTYAAQKQLASAPEEAAKALEYVQNLAEAGLAEMCALIFELRPEVLEQEGLAAALRKQTEALEVRHGLSTEFELRGDATPFALPFATKQAFYRIAQEALHNIVKHAAATHVAVRLTHTDDCIELEIADDGAGFETDREFPGHLGLKSMRERSLSLGGTFNLESKPGAGTTLTIEVPRG